MISFAKGVEKRPLKRLFYGPPGIGKSTVASKCSTTSDVTFVPHDGVVALDGENGLWHIGTARWPAEETWEKVLAQVKELCLAAGPWDTVLIDTVDAIEAKLVADVCATGGKKPVKTLTEFGYGDGFKAVGERWREFLAVLDLATNKGREVHLVAHCAAKTINDPQTVESYRKLIGAMTTGSWAETFQRMDAVLFCDHAKVVKDGRMHMFDRRVMHTVSGMGFDAKHRPNISPVLNLSWRDYESEVDSMTRSAQDIRTSIEGMIDKLPADALEKVTALLSSTKSNDAGKLRAIERKVRERIVNEHGQ